MKHLVGRVIGLYERSVHTPGRRVKMLTDENTELPTPQRIDPLNVVFHLMNGGVTGALQSRSALETVKRISLVVWGMRA